MAVGKGEEKEVTKWWERVKIGEEFRNSDGRKEAWENMRKYYKNQFAPEIVSVNLIYSHGRQLIPSLYYQNPVVEVGALFPGWEQKAKILEAVDNALLKKMRVKEQLKLIIQDAYLYDYGIRKIGYDAEFGYDPTSGVWAQLFEELGMEMTEDERLEFNTFILEEKPFFLRVPPNRFVVDPDTDGPGLETARWCAECFYRPLEDVLKDDRYEGVPKDLKATHIQHNQGQSVVISPKKEGVDYGDMKFGRDKERVKLWEVWDKEEKKVYVMIEGMKKFARQVEDQWGLQNFFPYDRLCFNPISDEHYSVSDAMYIEKQQLEYNDATTQEQLHRRKENLKIIWEEGTFSEEEETKLMSGNVGAGVKSRPNTVGGPNAKIMTIAPSMSRDIVQSRAAIREDIREILAVGPNQLGQEMGRRKTASEAMIIDQSVKIRGDERRDLIADFLGRAIDDINRLLFKFWDTPEVVKVVGPEGEAFEEWTGAYLESEYALRILPNSTLPESEEQYKQTLTQLYQMLNGDPYVDQKELRRLLLDSYKEFDTNRLLLQQPNEMQPMNMAITPGQAKHGDGSRISMPENPGAVNMSGAATEAQTPEGAEGNAMSNKP